MSRRIFIGVPFSDRDDLLLSKCRSIQKAHPKCRIVQPSAWHVTLVFPGNVSEENYLSIKAKVGQLAQEMWPFTLKSDKLVLMPEVNPTMLWLRMQLTEYFAGLYDHFHHRLKVKTIYAPNPHVTVMRWNPKVTPPKPNSITFDENFELNASEVLIYESFLQQGGSRYEVIDRFPLKRA